MRLQIRKACQSDKQAIVDIVIAAFGDLQGQEIADLVTDLLADLSAQPSLSLVGIADDCGVGHILFTNVRIKHSQGIVSAAILAPLSVRPGHQNQGIGGRLIQAGLAQLKAAGVHLVFVLGHPGYYPKYGFSAAGVKGFEAPYPIAPENSAAWMVQELHPGIIGDISGQVICADTLNDPKHWRE
ncbi:MAG: N-acetyltransferase [Desulfobacterales bacterium]